MTTRPLIRESLMLLNSLGLNPIQTHKKSSLRLFTPFLIYSALGVEVLMDIIFHWKGIDSTEGATVFIAIYQISPKMIVVIVYRKRLTALLTRIEQTFWPTDKYGKELKNDIEYMYSVIRKLFICAFLSGVLAFLAYSCKPFLISERSLPLDVYHPTNLDKSPDYEIAYGIQVLIVGGIGIPGLLGFDFLFASLTIHVVNELKMIKKGFAILPFSNDMYEEQKKEFTLLIDHHNLVLKCIKDINAIYSTLLLNQFLTSVFCICMGLFGIIISGFPPNLQQIMNAIPYLSTFMGLLFLYCIVGTLLITESESVAFAVYECNWWMSSQTVLKRSLILSIQRAQKLEKLTAGGMIPLNLETFASIIKTAFTYATLVQAAFAQSN